MVTWWEIGRCMINYTKTPPENSSGIMDYCLHKCRSEWMTHQRDRFKNVTTLALLKQLIKKTILKALNFKHYFIVYFLMNYSWVCEWFFLHHTWSNKGWVQLGSLDLDVKIWILDLQLNVKSEIWFQHWDHAEISVFGFSFYRSIGKSE